MTYVTVSFAKDTVLWKSMSVRVALSCSGFVYQNFLKPLFFIVDPEKMHEGMTGFGEMIGTVDWGRRVLEYCYSGTYPMLVQSIDGIRFDRPIGLSAGFDYDARLTDITFCVGFGFHSVGTITREAYGGNTRPILGRLRRSYSLMVNKGFKNKGVEVVMEKLSGKKFEVPVGISIGRTNSLTLQTHEACINDIVSAFEICEKSSVAYVYYELNISCPNLNTPVSFYDVVQLGALLERIDALKLVRPVYIKMPIECSDDLTLSLLEVIVVHRIQGVIFGNLQKNRKDPVLVPEEVAQFPVGNFSGKPTERRSNELISLAYRHYRDRLTIIGTGGVFSAEDAYRKIRLGASLVQLITGMVYRGPQLIGEINEGLVGLLKRDGYSHISDAIGVDSV